MATYYITRWNKVQNILFAALSFILISLVHSPVFSQEHAHGETCGHPGFAAHSESVYPKIEALENSPQFRSKFKSKYNFDYSSFSSVNAYFTGFFRQEIVEKTFDEKNISSNKIEMLFFELVEKFKERDDLWFEIPADHGIDKIYYGKHIFNPASDKEEQEDGVPKTADCFNAGFENNNWGGWQTYCARAINVAFAYADEQLYTPPNGCTTTGLTNPPAVSTPGQHSLVTGGNDGVGNFPRVFNGGVSAMIGNGAQAGTQGGGGNPFRQAAVLRKTFVVDASNPMITYSYAAVLDNGGGHPAHEQPFFNVSMTVDGFPYPCAAYSASANDGQPGWVQIGTGQNQRFYRDWTTIAVPLHTFIGSTVVLEFSVSDCSLSNGAHYAYAYIDVSCDNVEIEPFCQGTSTILQAPTDGIVAYEWVHSGETTSQVTITAPGTYDVYILPYGSPCSALLTYNAELYPIPTADFSVNHSSICIGGNIDFTNSSTVEAGGTITSYQWNFGDGISTPASSGTITGVPQTTGTYTNPNHVYNVTGNGNVILTIETADGCSHSAQVPVSVIPGPEATITGNSVVCNGDAPPEITFTGSLTPGPYTFTYNLDGGPDQYISTTPPNSSVTLPVPTTTPGTYNYNLTYVLDPSSAQCEQAQTGTVSIVVNPLPTATIATDATVCQGDAQPQITFTGSNGTSNYEFTYSVNGGANQTITTSGSSTASVNVSTATSGTFEYVLHSVTDVATGCSQALSGPGTVSTVVVNPMPDADITGAVVVCQNDAQPLITFTGTNSSGEYTFSYSINGGTPLTATTSGSNQITVNVPTNVAGTFTYELLNVSDPATGCNQNINETQVVTVNPLPTATIDGTNVVCQGGPSQQITFTGANGSSNYQFTYTLNGGPQETITTSGSSSVTITIPTTNPGVYSYQLVAVQDVATGCNQPQTGNATVTVNPMPDADISGATVVCQNDAQPVITFTGTNSSGEYTFTYNLNGGVQQSITTSGSNQSTINVPTNVAGTFVYELMNVSDPATGCNQNINETQTVIVNPLPAATIYGTTAVCQNAANPQITFTGDNGTSEYEFTYSINGGAPQTVTTSGSSSVTVNVPTDLSTVYVYTLHSVTDVTTGCFQAQTGSATVTVNPMPDASASGTTTVCQDAAAPVVSFTGQNSSGEYTFSYNINGGPTQTITTSGSNIATVTQSTAVPGTYVYQLTNVMDPASLCNQNIDHTETITVNPLPVANISAPVAACHMDTDLPEVTFSGSFGDAPYTFTYNLNGGSNLYASSVGSDVTFQVPTGTVGTFVYTITNIQEGSSLGCQQTQNVSTVVTIHALPNVSAGNDFYVCAGVPIILTGAGAQFYNWDNDVTNGVPFTPSDTTTYTVIGTDHNGCQNTDQITVDVIPIPVMDFEGVNLSGCSPVTPTFTNHSTGNLTNCTWYLGNGEILQGCGSVSSTFEVPGCFDVTLTVSTPEGCSNSLTINNYVCVEANPVADFYPDPSELTSYNWETQMINQTSGATLYEWSFGDGTGPSYEHSPFHAYPNDYSGTYQVMLVASTPSGCVDTAYATVNLKEELLFYVPNTFTPDGDDYNETFQPVFTTGFDPFGYTMYIFNRWGELVFETHNTDIGWNGRYGVDGKLCQDGTYTWKIEVKMRSSSEHRQYVGHVNIIR